MKKRYGFLAAALLSAVTLVLGGCGSDSSSGQKILTSGSSTELPVFESPTVFVPSADGKEYLGSEPLLLDVSNMSQGYLIACSSSEDSRCNLQLSDPSGIAYSYFISPGEHAVIPFSGGEGEYLITAYEQITDSNYSALYLETVDLTLDNIFYPFLYPNQYVSFTEESEASKLAITLLPEDATELDILDEVYRYVTENITYDEEKAETVEVGYLPDIDETLHTGTGICFDYAALMTCMLRSRDIPCKLQIGYSGSVKHAWIDVYTRSTGWIEQAIAFDGKNWTRMDPTFNSTSSNFEDIHQYIGDGNNYTVQFTR
ncbi:MAG: transglutaminase domain-containing protein [Clostridiales bacterium]|nr:transglutaminase domain-containing protein [Candidatus Blautia equi]